MHLNLSPQGSGILTAAFVLAIMIVPYAASLSAEFIKMVPYAQAGVDFISFGALTHSVKGLDMSFKAC